MRALADQTPPGAPGGRSGKGAQGPAEASRVGAHLVEVEPPDTLVVRIAGDLSGGEVSRMLDLFERLAVGPGRAFLLVDLARMGHVSPEARRISGQRQLPPAYGGLALFGGTFQQRLVAKLATTAGWLLRGRSLGKPRPACVEDERAARAWIDERRTGG